jgi:hypothetical protein
MGPDVEDLNSEDTNDLLQGREVVIPVFRSDISRKLKESWRFHYEKR